LLLLVVDASDPTHDSQLDVTRRVLHEIGADSVPTKLLFNKADLLDDEARERLLRKHGEGALVLSAHDARDVTTLREAIIDFFEAKMVDEELIVPYARQGLIGDVYENARVLSEEYGETGTRLRVRALPAAIERLRHVFAD
jgi:GTP-binding protein HflX